ncbi:MAG: aminotransferase class I/II-fold pyridoxal phosphate-dependent enzyme [Anaerolineae bacterium]|jgi:LL-diaminopimelate aminotransferase
MMATAERLAKLPPYPFARWEELVIRARQRGLDVIRLDVGDPDMPPPDSVIQALCRSASRPDHHGYPGYRGIPALRQAIADYYARRFQVSLDADTQVLPLIGSKEGLINLSLAYLDPGDLALVPDPGYAPYARGAILAGAEFRTFPLLPERGFLPDLEAIPAGVADRANVLWLNYPNNPTGATADLGFFTHAVDFARRHNLLLCHDAPYVDVTYGSPAGGRGGGAPSVLQVPGASEVAIEFNSLSKLANMAGWRVGMAVGNAQAVAALGQVKSNVDSGLFLPLQEAAIEALSTDPAWIAERNQIYLERLEHLVDGLQGIGMAAPLPEATLYLWVPIPGTAGDPNRSPWTSESFARMLLDTIGVAVAPGSFFGPAGEGFVRVSATTPTERIQQAVRRLVTLGSSWAAAGT